MSPSWPSYPGIPPKISAIDDTDRVDTPTAPKRMERIWTWECEQEKHPAESKPGTVPDKCKGERNFGYYKGECGSEDFHKIGESEREAKWLMK